MSTNARIGILNPDGMVTSVYTHWDGYPEHHLDILSSAYTVESHVRALLSYGDMSTLGPNLAECKRYHEPNCEPKTHPINAWPDSGQEFEYLYRTGQWEWRSTPYREPASAWVQASNTVYCVVGSNPLDGVTTFTNANDAAAHWAEMSKLRSGGYFLEARAMSSRCDECGVKHPGAC